MSDNSAMNSMIRRAAGATQARGLGPSVDGADNGPAGPSSSSTDGHDAMNEWIRNGRAPEPPAPRDPEQDARIVAALEAAGEPVPRHLRPKGWSNDYGQGPRGTSIPTRPSVNEAIREGVRRSASGEAGGSFEVGAVRESMTRPRW